MRARIEVMLSLWGRWALKRATGGLGFPSVSPMFKDAPRGDGYGSAIPLGFSDQDMEALDAAVNRLPAGHHFIVMEVYQRGGSMRAVAARIGFHPKAITQYLNQAYEKIIVDMEKQSAQNRVNSDSFHSCVQTNQPASA